MDFASMCCREFNRVLRYASEQTSEEPGSPASQKIPSTESLKIMELRIELFKERKAAKRFAEAEKTYHEIMSSLPENDRGSKSDLMYEFANMLIEQKKYKDAEMVAREVLEHRKLRSPGSPEFILSYRQLSSTLFHQQSPAEEKKAVEMYRDMWENGSPHDWKAENGDRLGQIYAKQDQYDEAQGIHHKVWKERRKHAGIQDEATLNSAWLRIHMLDAMLKNRPFDEEDTHKNYWEGKIREFLTEIWEEGKRVPETNINLFAIGHRLGRIHFDRREYAKAEVVFDEVRNRRMKSLGDKSMETWESYHQLARSICAQADVDKEKFARFKDVFKSLWEARKRLLQDLSPKTTPSSSHLAALESGFMYGLLLVKLGDNSEAERILEPLWRPDIDSAGEASQLKVGHFLGVCLARQGKYSKAQEVLRLVVKRLGPDAEKCLDTSKELDEVDKHCLEEEKTKRPKKKIPKRGGVVIVLQRR